VLTLLVELFDRPRCSSLLGLSPHSQKPPFQNHQMSAAALTCVRLKNEVKNGSNVCYHGCYYLLHSPP
jgi:hypothetical protein